VKNVSLTRKDVEQYAPVIKNYAKSVLAFKDMQNAWEKRLDSFIKEIMKVFLYIENWNLQKDYELIFGPEALSNSVRIAADASEKKKFKMRFYRNLLINRLNSLTKNRNVIYKVLVNLFKAFLDCLDEHNAINYKIQEYLILSAVGMQSQAGDAFAEFIQGPLTEAIFKKKADITRKINQNNLKQNAI
jgi:hypothetical protein